MKNANFFPQGAVMCSKFCAPGLCGLSRRSVGHTGFRARQSIESQLSTMMAGSAASNRL
jgi:hypothetical protein